MRLSDLTVFASCFCGTRDFDHAVHHFNPRSGNSYNAYDFKKGVCIGNPKTNSVAEADNASLARWSRRWHHSRSTFRTLSRKTRGPSHVGCFVPAFWTYTVRWGTNSSTSSSPTSIKALSTQTNHLAYLTKRIVTLTI